MSKRKYYRIGKKRFHKKHLKRLLICICIGLIIGLLLTIKIDGQVVEAETAETATQVIVEEKGDKVQIELPQDSGTIEDQIRQIAKENDFEWEDYLVRLAKCESNFNPNAVNIQGNTPKGSRDRGIMQINDYWHKEVSDEQAFNLEWSVNWAIENINAGRQDMWSCNRIIKNK